MSGQKKTVDEILEYYRLYSTPSSNWNRVLQDNARRALKELVMQYIEKWKPSHTYGSENAAIYRAYDHGFKTAVKETIEALNKLFEEG